MKVPSLLLSLTLLGSSCIAAFADDDYKDPTKPVEDRVKDVVSQLTLDEKLSLLRGVHFGDTHAIPRLGIPAFKMMDGPVGVRDGQSHVYAGGVSLAASFDVDMAKRVGVALGRDCKARGFNILLGPAMNLMRSPVSGRNFEYLGEDPIVAGDIAANYVQGLQSQGVAATIKHFVCNDQEFDRDHIPSEVDERTMRELYLKPFEIAVKKGGAWCVMDAYNPVNDLHMTENDFLNNHVLKGDWGFKGLVMSDWWALGSTLGEANGGLDLEMPGDAAPMPGHPKYMSPKELKPLIDAGQISQATIDDKVSRFFRVVFSMGWMEHPATDPSISKDNDPQCDQTALDGAREGIVLLKNKDNLLPLDPNKVKKIVIIGHNAEMDMAAGGGSAHANFIHGASLIQALSDVGGSGIQVVEIPWKDANNKPYGDEGNPALPDGAADQIKSADAVIACVGYNDYNVDYWSTNRWRHNAEGEGMDRSYELPDGQPNVIKALAALNPKTIVVLNAGAGVETASWLDSAQSLIDAFYSGQSEGTAVAEIIFGKTNPSGKLPFSWEKRLEDCASTGNFPTKENTPGKTDKDNVLLGYAYNTYKEGVMIGYRYFDTKNIEPLFPFGFGLSYTTFSFDKLQVATNPDKSVTATVTVKNTGTVAGSEVAELYVAPPAASVPRPVHELKGFARVTLQPGESKDVTISVPQEDLAYWDPSTKNWTVTPGSYEIQVGDSSRNLPQKAKVTE